MDGNFYRKRCNSGPRRIRLRLGQPGSSSAAIARNAGRLGSNRGDGAGAFDSVSVEQPHSKRSGSHPIGRGMSIRCSRHFIIAWRLTATGW